MNNEKVAAELVKVAKSLTARYVDIDEVEKQAKKAMDYLEAAGNSAYKADRRNTLGQLSAAMAELHDLYENLEAGGELDADMELALSEAAFQLKRVKP